MHRARSVRSGFVGAAGAIALAAGVARAQDSVSAAGGLPGDATGALSAGASGEQRNDYVVDLAPCRSSWGSRYRVGPVIKASAAPGTGQGSGQFSQLIGAVAISASFDPTVPLAPVFAAWRAPGQGVNAIRNLPPADDGTGRFGNVAGPGVPLSFAVACMEFGPGANGLFGDGDDEQAVVTGLLSTQSADPRRVYVSRVVSAVNKLSPAASGTASFGVGSVDARGFTHLLADGFGMSSASAVPDKRLYRIDARARSAGLNALSTSGATDPTATRLLVSTATPLSVPGMVPENVAGRPVLAALDFSGACRHEGAPGTLLTSTAHIAPGEAARGPMTLAVGSGPYARLNPAGNAIGVGCALVTVPGLTGPRVRSIAAWGVTAGGGPVGGGLGRLRVDLPSGPGVLIDPTDGFDLGGTVPPLGTAAEHEFTNHQSQVSFRGSGGPVAAVVLPGGDLLLAATVASSGSSSGQPQGFDQAIVVASVSAANGTVAWTVAAHTGDGGSHQGKAVRGDFGADGLPGTFDPGEGDGVIDVGVGEQIGNIERLDAALPGATSGPSLSSPALDRAGNVYFTAACRFRSPSGIERGSVALLRGNYDPQNHGYQLERLLEVGDTLEGLNSLRPYRVASLSLADGDSVDSAAPSSASIVQGAVPGVDAGALPYGDARSIGALAVRATITYDRDLDGRFADPTLPGHAGSPDESYEAVLLMMPDAPAGARVDFNGDGAVDPDDLADFIACYFGLPPCAGADYSGDGLVDPDDLADYIAAYFAT